MERGTSGNSNLPELHNNFMSHSGWGPFCETISRIINLRTYIIYTVCYMYIIVYDTTNVYIYISYIIIYIYIYMYMSVFHNIYDNMYFH